MDRREREDDPETAMRAALAGWQATIETSVVGIVQSFDPVAQTCTVQPAIQARVRSPKGEMSWVTLPLLVDVPVVFPSGGGFTLTFPIVKGDEALVVFGSRCIDSWWQSGAVGPQAELRMHDLSDGFALVGPRSQPRKLPAYSATTVQLRADDGSTYIEMSAGQMVKVVAPGGINLNGVMIDAAGNVTTAADVVAGGKSLRTHRHSGVQTGGGTTGAPV
jgi:hypothetical protein